MPRPSRLQRSQKPISRSVKTWPLRKAVSAVAGCPLLLSVQADPVSLGFCRRPDLPALVQQGPAAAGHAALTRHLPMIGRNVEAYSAAYEQTLSQRTTWKRLPNRNSAPRIVLDPHFGLCALGCTAGQALLAGKIYRHTIDIILRHRFGKIPILAAGGFPRGRVLGLRDGRFAAPAKRPSSPAKSPW